MTRLMVLGGGRHQLSLIRRARERGLEVVLVDYLDDAPGRALATTSLLLSTLDVEAVAEAARAHDVDGVVTTGTDLPVVTMASVAASLGLPAWIGPDAAVAATTKSRMRPALAAVGVPMAPQVVVEPGQDPPAVTLPAVVKPADSQGQRGVERVDRSGDLPAALARARRHARAGQVVVESFLHGPEVTASAWVEGDRVVLLALNDRVTINPPPHLGIAHRHVHPSRHAGTAERTAVTAMLERIATAYGMATGPLYVQFILAPGGPVVVEAAARVGGGHESSLFPLVAGSRVEDRLIELALVGTCEPWDPSALDHGVAASVTFVLGRAGTVARLDPITPVDGTVEAGWYIAQGDRLRDLTDSLGRIGWFVTTGPDRVRLDQRVARQYAGLRVLDPAGASLVRHPEPALLLGA